MYRNTTTVHYCNGEIHRDPELDLPAVIFDDYHKIYVNFGVIHRDKRDKHNILLPAVFFDRHNHPRYFINGFECDKFGNKLNDNNTQVFAKNSRLFMDLNHTRKV